MDALGTEGSKDVWIYGIVSRLWGCQKQEFSKVIMVLGMGFRVQMRSSDLWGLWLKPPMTRLGSRFPTCNQPSIVTNAGAAESKGDVHPAT